MMGSAIPTQSSLNDLLILLQGLQAAADPKQVKANIEKIAAERAKYDDAIAESVVAAKSATEAAVAAAAATQKMEAATAKLDSKQAKLDAQAEELKAEKAEIVLNKAQVDKQFAAAKDLMESLAVDRQNLTLEFERKDVELSKARDALAIKSAALESAIMDADAVKAEYAAKLNQFKALAG